jgi:hypothetical protein
MTALGIIDRGVADLSALAISPWAEAERPGED